MELAPDQINYFRQQGYTDQEIMEAATEVQRETTPLMSSYNRAMNTIPTSTATTLVAGMQQENLIKWQLELDSILERIEHILRGDKPRFVNGNLVFLPPENDNDKVLSETGVADIMQLLSLYLNRNTILSNYDETTILWKVRDFGEEVSDLIFLKYEEMGLDTLEKRKRYPMIVLELVDTVHSAYLRALNGGERDSLRQARHITQNEPIGGSALATYPLKERSMLNPMRWLKGKYG